MAEFVGPEGIELREGIEPGRIEELLVFYEAEWWTQGRDREGVERMLAGSDAVISAVDGEAGSLAGFARALSDGACRATIYDLIVAPEWRGKGLGRAILERIRETPALRDTRRMDLHCKEDVAGFYESLGFERSAPDQVRMQWNRPRGHWDA